MRESGDLEVRSASAISPVIPVQAVDERRYDPGLHHDADGRTLFLGEHAPGRAGGGGARGERGGAEPWNQRVGYTAASGALGSLVRNKLP